MGFQTNIDDFLKKLDSFVDNEHVNTMHRSKASRADVRSLPCLIL